MIQKRFGGNQIMDKKIPYFKAEEIAEKSWMITNAFVENSYANCYLIEGEDYALLIDSILGMGNLKAFCETLTDKPIRVANTHSHSDHVGGNFLSLVVRNLLIHDLVSSERIFIIILSRTPNRNSQSVEKVYHGFYRQY